MNTGRAEITGTLQPDGTLVLDQKPDLPAGRVRVVVESLLDLPVEDPFFRTLQEIWRQRQAAGLKPRSVEAVEAERHALREGMDREIDQAGQIQEESRQLRQERGERRGEPA